MPTIAIIGAGPGLGLAIARTFGSRGFSVALISRSQDKLDALASQLASENITAEGFSADVLDVSSVRGALVAARERFGAIDVLEYSPADASAGPLAPVDVRQAAPENVQAQIEYYLYGAMAAADTLLPAMRETGSGTLLFTTGAGSVHPIPMFGNVSIGAAALRNWAINLGSAEDAGSSGVYVAHVAIGVMIGDTAPAGFAALPASVIAERYWELYRNRRDREILIAP